jgi:hypothetical protein
MQIGSQDTSLKVIEDRIQYICADQADSGVVILGDIVDEDRPSTRGMRTAAFADRPEVISRDGQNHLLWIDKFVIPKLLPLQKIKYGIMGVLAGHHFTQLTPSLNSAQYICNRVKEITGRPVPYLGEMSSFLDLRFRDDRKGIRVVGHLQHGVGGGQTKGSTIQKLERTAQGFEADFYMRAHDCQLVATKTDRLYPKRSQSGSEPEMMSRTIAMLNLGAATRGYEMKKNYLSYVEKEMMRPTTLGWGSLHFSIRKAHKYEDEDQSYKADVSIVI